MIPLLRMGAKVYEEMSTFSDISVEQYVDYQEKGERPMRAAIIAFSMYSRIPMPMFEWKEEDMKYAMCFFPAIGMVIGTVFYGMFLLLSWLLPGSFLAAGILLAVPIFITGGIHMDGFMDTCDARASYGDREKKLAILKGYPHGGVRCDLRRTVSDPL